MTLDELYELKERLIDAQMELEKVQNEIDTLPDEVKVAFDELVIW